MPRLVSQGRGSVQPGLDSYPQPFSTGQLFYPLSYPTASLTSTLNHDKVKPVTLFTLKLDGSISFNTV